MNACGINFAAIAQAQTADDPNTSQEFQYDSVDSASIVSRALTHFRPKLDQSLPIIERTANFWAIAVAVRGLAATDVLAAELMRLARESGFTRALGRNGTDDVAHLIRWAMFERCPIVVAED